MMNGIRWITLMRLTVDDMIHWSRVKRGETEMTRARALMQFALGADVDVSIVHQLADGLMTPDEALELQLCVAVAMFTPEMVCKACRVPDAMIDKALGMSFGAAHQRRAKEAA